MKALAGMWVFVALMAAAPSGVRAQAGEAGKAVTEFKAEEGFKMSERALRAIGVRFARLEGNSPWVIAPEALVRIKHSTGVYRRYEGWISFVLVNVKSKGPRGYLVASDDLQPEDEVAVQGVSYLRMTEADLNSDTVDSCAH